MRSSNRPQPASITLASAALSLALCPLAARAEPLAQGFAVERYAPAPPGADWLVLDNLRLAGGLGAGIAVTSGYARRPFSVSLPNSATLDVVSHQAFADVAMAVFYDRFRFSLNVTDPLHASGQSGTAAGSRFRAPAVDLGQYPDKVTDLRVSVDARVFGAVSGPLRFGLSTQLWVPSGERSLYASDGTLRVMLRALVAGESGLLAYSGSLGVHVRPLDDSRVPGAPRGSELLFAFGVGPRFQLSRVHALSASIGPELWGATAWEHPFGQQTTGVEALLGMRLQHVTQGSSQSSVKFGFGEGLHSQFGAPEWRAVLSVETYGRVP